MLSEFAQSVKFHDALGKAPFRSLKCPNDRHWQLCLREGSQQKEEKNLITFHGMKRVRDNLTCMN